MTTLTKKEQNKVLAALDQLDHDKDDHWNKDGSPTVSVVADMSGVKALTKADLQEIAPDFKRAEQPADDKPADEATAKDRGLDPVDPPAPGSHGAEGSDPASQGALPDNAPRPDADQYASENNPKATDHEQPEANGQANLATNAQVQPQPVPGAVDQGDTVAQEELARQQQAADEVEDQIEAEVRDLQAELDKANADLDEAMAEVQDAKRRVTQAQNRVNFLQNRLERTSFVHHDRSAATVAGYLKSQQKVRDERVRQYEQLKAEGKIGPTRSRLDTSMARRTGYGHGRPNMPLVGGKDNGKK